MEILIDIVLKAGRSAVELSLFILLPVMVVMLSLMLFLESRGVLDWVAKRLAPVLKPFGLNGYGVFAMLQVNLVSFAAPVATLAMMEQRGISDRRLATTFGMVMAMAQANVSLPMVAMGLDIRFTFLWSLIGGLAAAAATWYGFARHLPAIDQHPESADNTPHKAGHSNLLEIINRGGAEAFRIATGAIPMLVLTLTLVMVLRETGAIKGLTWVMSPLLTALSLDSQYLLPSLTKYLGGGTAMMGVMAEMFQNGQSSPAAFNRIAGFLVHPLDVPGIAVLITAGRRVAGVWIPAALGAAVGIGVRTLGHALWYG